VRSVLERDGGRGEWSRSFFLGGDDEGGLGPGSCTHFAFGKCLDVR
jgi:hypothetical protein